MQKHAGVDFVKTSTGFGSQGAHAASLRLILENFDESTLEVIASSLTDNHVGDPAEVPNLLDQIKNPIDELIGDGAYDTKKSIQYR